MLRMCSTVSKSSSYHMSRPRTVFWSLKFRGLCLSPACASSTVAPP